MINLGNNNYLVIAGENFMLDRRLIVLDPNYANVGFQDDDGSSGQVFKYGSFLDALNGRFYGVVENFFRYLEGQRDIHVLVSRADYVLIYQLYCEVLAKDFGVSCQEVLDATLRKCEMYDGWTAAQVAEALEFANLVKSSLALNASIKVFNQRSDISLEVQLYLFSKGKLANGVGTLRSKLTALIANIYYARVRSPLEVDLRDALAAKDAEVLAAICKVTPDKVPVDKTVAELTEWFVDRVKRNPYLEGLFAPTPAEAYPRLGKRLDQYGEEAYRVASILTSYRDPNYRDQNRKELEIFHAWHYRGFKVEDVIAYNGKYLRLYFQTRFTKYNPFLLPANMAVIRDTEV